MTSETSTASSAARLASQIPRPGVVITIALWTVLFVPLANLQSLRFEEGMRGLLARDILLRHDWLDPQLSGLTYLAKPPLLPWLIAVCGWFIGGVDDWAVRLPPLFATLTMGLTAYWLVRPIASRAAAVFSAAATMLTPMVMLKANVVATDTTASAFCFLAFAVFWQAERLGSPRLGRWMICGSLMGFAALAKGPPPLLYPVFGILAVRLSRDGWHGLGGLLISVLLAAGILAVWVVPHLDAQTLLLWRGEMQLDHAAKFSGLERMEFIVTVAIQTMPTLLLALPGLIPAWRRYLGIAPDLPNALAFYALMGTVLFLVANADAGRFAMPAVPALGAAAGLVFDGLRRQGSRLARPAMLLLCALGGFQLITNYVVTPLRLGIVRQNRQVAEEINHAVAANPGPVLFLHSAMDLSVLFYVEHPLHFLDDGTKPPTGHVWVLLGGNDNTAPPMAQQQLLLQQPILDLRSRNVGRLRLYRL